MKVLVTGGAGFIGSHVCEYYRNKDDEVVAFDNLTKHELDRTGYNVEQIRDYNTKFLKDIGVRFVKGDIRDADVLMNNASDCDYIVHTAAQPAMTISIEDPVLDFKSNVEGTFNVLETARKYDIPMVSCATIHVYGNEINKHLTEGRTRYMKYGEDTIDETHPTVEGVITPLHASKRCGDLYVESYIDTYGMEVASFRLSGLYGTRQFGGEDHGWVANFVIRTLLGLPLTVYGTGKQVRDILYATDVVKAFDAFYVKRKAGMYNIGGGVDCSISLIECIKLIEEITGIKPVVKYENGRLGDLRYFVCDIEKAELKLGWRPMVNPKQGVGLMVDWVKWNMEMFKK